MRSIEEIQADLIKQAGGKKEVYQKIEHPSFSDWTCHQPCEERWEMILQNLGHPSPTLGGQPRRCLDLGCHSGWFCRAFSRLGWSCIGIDKDPLVIEIAKNRLIIEDTTGVFWPSYQCRDFCVFIPLPYSDVLLCLSLIMYIFEEDSPGKGWKYLNHFSQSSPKMFLDCGGMYSHRLPFVPEDAGQAIVDNTTYTSFELLGNTALEGRPFYVFDR